MDSQRSAELQVLLEGVPLPATKEELVAHARRQDVEAAALLEPLPEREYRSLDEVGEALAPVQPPRDATDPPQPHEESGDPPGGAAYVDPNPEPGVVRPDAPPWNPPQKTLEEQSSTLKEQQERQRRQG